MLAKIPIEGNIVADYYIGNSHILISDAAYAGKSEADVRQVLDRVGRIAEEIIRGKQQREAEAAAAEKTQT